MYGSMITFITCYHTIYRNNGREQNMKWINVFTCAYSNLKESVHVLLLHVFVVSSCCLFYFSTFTFVFSIILCLSIYFIFGMFFFFFSSSSIERRCGNSTSVPCFFVSENNQTVQMFTCNLSMTVNLSFSIHRPTCNHPTSFIWKRRNGVNNNNNSGTNCVYLSIYLCMCVYVW